MSRLDNMAAKRLERDYMSIIEDPLQYVKVHPLPENILIWHFAILGPEGTPFERGIYHGKLVFPGRYPFEPPRIYMITPNGRFKCNTPICFRFQSETWNPTSSVSRILTGLLSLMVEKIPAEIATFDDEIRLLAARSLEFNLKDSVFCDLFPELKEECRQRIKSMQNSRVAKIFTLGAMVLIVVFASLAYSVKYIMICGGSLH